MLYTDLNEVKALLEIDPANKAEDKKLGFLIAMASSWIEEYVGRDLELRSRTEYLHGTGTQKLQLKYRPVYLTPRVWVDDGGYYGSASGAFTDAESELTYGTDFAIRLDEENTGTSRSGLLIRINDYWPRFLANQRGLLSPFVTEGLGNIKVSYSGGYTQDTLPANIRFAANILVARMRFLFPVGMEVTAESYEDRSINYIGQRKDYLLGLVKPHLHTYRNWRF